MNESDRGRVPIELIKAPTVIVVNSVVMLWHLLLIFVLKGIAQQGTGLSMASLQSLA